MKRVTEFSRTSLDSNFKMFVKDKKSTIQYLVNETKSEHFTKLIIKLHGELFARLYKEKCFYIL